MTEVDRIRSHLILSTAAGGLVLVIAIWGYSDGADVGRTDRAILAIALNLAYVLGVSMALWPNWRSRADRSRPEGAGAPEEGPSLPGPPRRGHHPECDAFSGHTVRWRGRTRCAGCLGLTVGAIVAILLTAVYVVEPEAYVWVYGPGLTVAGTALVAVGLFAAMAGSLDPRAGMGLNALMMLGFALVSIGLLESTGEITWALVGVVVSALWMDTRIQVSRWNHAVICVACEKECVAYAF
jgi:hypothetical protein